MDIFDSHVRLVPRDGALERLLEVMDSCGVARAVASGGGTVDLLTLSRQLVKGGHSVGSADNAFLLDAAAQSGGRIVPRYFANPHEGIDEYERIGAGFIGVEVSPGVHGTAFDDPRVERIVQAAARHRHTVYTVCLNRPGSGVADLIDLARRHTDVTFILGHCGIGNIDYYGVDLIADVENILVETSGGYSGVLRFAIDTVGLDRIMFGSEYPLQHPSVELVKYDSINLSASETRAVLWRNAHAWFTEEVFSK